MCKPVIDFAVSSIVNAVVLLIIYWQHLHFNPVLFQLATHEVVEICGKILYQVELSRSSLDHMWGFSVEAELIENSERQDELCCYISRVEDRSTAMQNGVYYSLSMIHFIVPLKSFNDRSLYCIFMKHISSFSL